MEFLGYQRPDGTVGVRNYLLVLPTCACVTHVATQISENIKNSVAIQHQHGCGQFGLDFEQTFRTLAGFGSNPNVAAVLVVGLGCESVSPEKLADKIAKTGKPVETVIVQHEGGTIKSIEKGLRIGKEMALEISRLKTSLFSVSELVVGVECGGSDTTSGLVANPAVGVAADMIIDDGGTVILSETTELIGAEHLLVKRAVNNDVADRILKIVHRLEKKIVEMGGDIRGANPSPGNIKAGITTIEEKSLGAIEKAEHTSIVGVLEYGERPQSKGLYIMDTPGHDVESITGMIAGGSQLIMFTTGLGTPIGSPITPVVKVTANPKTYENMKDNIDVDVSSVLKGDESIRKAGSRIFRCLLEVASGKKTKSEILGHKEFAINRIGLTL